MRTVLSAVALVVGAGLRNRARIQLRRIRQPRYLVATLVGVAWYWVTFRPLVAYRGAAPRPPASEPALELLVAALALVPLAFQWVLGGDRAAIAFSEAEVQLLFPAPLTRRELLHYRLLRALASSLAGAIFVGVVLGRGRPLLLTLGAWIAFSTMSFHGIGAALTRATLAGAGLAGLRRRLVTLAALLAFVGLLALGVRGVAPPGPPEPTLAYARAWADAVEASPLAWILWPIRAPVRLVLAGSALDFLRALPAALLVLALHYAWVLSSAVQFEEASAEAAEQRARQLEALRAGRGALPGLRSSGARRAPFRLGAEGPPETAFLWKGLIAGGRALGSPRFLIAATGLATGLLGSAIVLTTAFGQGRAALAAVAGTLWAVAVLVGPRLVRSDLRADAGNLEALRALPIPGVRVVRGELLAPAVTLAVAQWLVLPFLAVSLPSLRVSPAAAATAVAALAAVGPALTLVLLVVQAGLVVLLPGWAGAADRPRGPEAFGANVLVGLASLLALGIALVPALVAGGVVGLALAPLVDAHARVLAGAAAGAGVLAAEAAIGARLLGAAFDRMDVTD